MKDIIKFFDDLSPIAKLILCIPVLNIAWWIYRIAKALDTNNTTALVVAIVILVVGVPFWWVIDLVCLLVNKKIWWLC